jgi:hypothetical protein
VSGAAQGIGLAIAKRYAAEIGGDDAARAVACDVTPCARVQKETADIPPGCVGEPDEIAHGHLTLSLMPALLPTVPAGSVLRASAEFLDVRREGVVLVVGEEQA